MDPEPARLSRLRGDHAQFSCLLLALVAANIPYWDTTVWPDNDTVTIFQVFYTFYNNWFLHGEFTRWLPYGTYGLQADYYQLSNLTPASYLVGLAGGVLRAGDVLLLFKISILVEQIMMLTGMFLLCGRLYQRAATRFFICLGMCLSTVWLLQAYWNFRIYYLLPLALYFLVGWLESSRLRDLALAGTVCVYSLVGNVVYFGALYILLLLLFVIAFLLHSPPKRKALLRPRGSDAPWVVLFLASACLYLYFAAHMLDDIRSIQPGRDPGSKAVALEHFLSDGSGLGLHKFIDLVLPWPAPDYTFFIGLLPLVFLGYALVLVRSDRFIAFGIPALYVSLLSLGNSVPVAFWTYLFFPPMRWFHYIGQTPGLLRFFLLVCAGFGFEHFLADKETVPSPAHGRHIRHLFLALSAAVVLAGAGAALIYRELIPVHYVPTYSIALVSLAAVCLFLSLAPASSRRSIGYIAAVFLALDLGLFHYHVLRSWHCRWTTLDPVASRVRPYSFQAVRAAEPPPGSASEAAQRAVESHPTQRLAVESSQFVQFDRGWPMKYLALLWGEGINRLLVATGNFSAQWVAHQGVVYDFDRKALEAAHMGWGAPKIRLVASAAYATSVDAASHLVRETDLYGTPVLENVPAEWDLGGWMQPPEQSWGDVDVLSYTFNRLDITVRVRLPRGAFLYYADAYHPGWKAFVDGTPAPVFRANLAFKAVRLSEGTHRVRLVYSDGLRDFVSAAIALSSCVFAAALVLRAGTLVLRWRSATPTTGGCRFP